MGPLGSVFRDLLFFQGYVADPDLLRELEQRPAADPVPAPASPPAPAAPILRPAH